MKINGFVVAIGVIIGLLILSVLIFLNPFGIVLWSDTGTMEDTIVWANEQDAGIQTSNISRAAGSAVYILPIGGFDFPDIFSVSNSSYDFNYTFYSRSWGPGLVKYEIDPLENCGRIVSNDTLQVRVEPMGFTAEPHHNYTSKVHIETGPAFETTFNQCGDSGAQVRIRMNVTLEDHAKHLCNDSLTVFTPLYIWPGYYPFAYDRFMVEEKSLEMNPGETILLNTSFYRGWQAFSTVSYVMSKTPLTVTVDPATFLANRAIREYPGVMKIHADENLSPGTYPFYLKIKGSSEIFRFRDNRLLFTVNVTAPKSQSGPVANS